MVGCGFLARRTVFTLAELCTDLGVDAFTGGQVTTTTFALRDLFRPAGPDAVTLEHSVFAEYLAARYLRTARGRAVAATITPEALISYDKPGPRPAMTPADPRPRPGCCPSPR